MFFHIALARAAFVSSAILLLFFSTGCSAKRERVFVTGLFDTHEIADAAYRELEQKDILYRTKGTPNRLTEHDVRNAGFIPYITNGDGTLHPRKNVSTLKGHKAFDEVFRTYPDTLNILEPADFIKLADEKSLWSIETYQDERMHGEEPYLYINKEEEKPKGVEAWFIFVMRLNPDTGIREVILLSKETKTKDGKDTRSAPLIGILDGMGRVVGGAATGFSKGF